LPIFCQKRAPLSVTLCEISFTGLKTHGKRMVNFLGRIRMWPG
jgi:hypothetical protein